MYHQIKTIPTIKSVLIIKGSQEDKKEGNAYRMEPAVFVHLAGSMHFAGLTPSSKRRHTDNLTAHMRDESKNRATNITVR